MEKRIAEIISRCKAIDAEQAVIERKAELENEGKFSDEQRTAYAALKGEFDSLLAEKKQIEDDAEMRAARSGRAAELQPRAIARRAEPGSGAPAKTGTAIENGEEEESPRIRFKIPARALRSGAPRNFMGEHDGMKAEERAYRFGMWAMARMQQCIPSMYFPEATKFVNNYMGGVYNTAHSELDGTTGGHFLVPVEFSSDLIVLRERYGVARQILQRKQMNSDTLHTPKRASGLTAYFVGENAAATESNMTWQDILLVAKDLVCLARMSNQLSADAAIAVGDELAGEISYAFANKADDCAVNGDGTSTYAGIAGVRTLLTSTDGAGTDSAGVVTQTTSNTWTAQVLADFNNVVGKLPAYADGPNTVWVCHRTYYASVMQKLEAAGGGNALRDIAQGDRASRPLFLGYPVVFSQVFPSVTATTGVTAVLGDFGLGGIFGDRQQTSIAFSEHATINSENVFERNQIAIRGTQRFDINIHGCGTSAVVGPIVGLQTG